MIFLATPVFRGVARARSNSLGTQGWDEVERFDCCHGHCHLHPDGQAESETLYQLDGPDDVQEAYAKASVYAGERARIIRDKGGE